ncbi:MAG: hypothetical protein JF887_00650 [Candidatus Dormibacteraeota bacterium]|uniref:Uncharacterized protein n=1 Tax=Candidatus Amunia macphersoniae TaxID=3127014 RepID=A0A934NIF1_9BACT|nr:hypothetical protein [Candidatus Dormibacteraeota bacterium]
MSTNSFLSIAEGRVDHLRQLSHHERSLEWVNASISEVESEIPDLELSMAVYRRLNPNAADVAGSGAPAFLGIAGVRADHLRQLSHHMRALNWVSAPLAEIESEIPELDKAMSVYRRLLPESGETGRSDTGATAKSSSPAAAAKGRPASTRGARDTDESTDPPSFKEYALQHLDAVAVEDGADERESSRPGANGSASTF